MLFLGITWFVYNNICMGLIFPPKMHAFMFVISIVFLNLMQSLFSFILFIGGGSMTLFNKQIFFRINMNGN